jgi:hypothetical protein
MGASRVWTGRCGRQIGGRVFAAEVSVRAEPTDAATSVALAPAAEAELARAFGSEAGHYAQGVRSSVAAQIACAPVAGDLPAVGRSRFRVEVVGGVPPAGAEREVAEFLFFVASMEAIAAYLVAFEAEAAKTPNHPLHPTGAGFAAPAGERGRSAAEGFGMGEPFYIRPPEFLYCLRTNPAYGWETGVTDDGSQVLRCKRHWLVFDPAGHLLQASDEPVGFRHRPIEVRRFWLPERSVGVEDLPDTLAEFYTAPDEYQMEPGDPEAWISAGQFVFYPGWSEYIMGPGGRVEAS